MRYAIRLGVRVEATPKQTAHCPVCHTPVRAKCGAIVTWHWAHIADDCDQWAEPTDLWHHWWQELVPAIQRERVIGNHRADIIATDGTVVELQHSAISVADIQARETFYRRMIWIFDARAAYTTERLDIRDRGTHHTFRWKHPRKSIATCRLPVYLDLGNGQLLLVRRIHTESPCGGWGTLVPVTEIFQWLNGRAP